MKLNKYSCSIFLLVSILTSLPSIAQQDKFHIKTSNGPFANELILTEEQEGFSSWWKSNIKSQLGKSVNFAGHYRLFVSKGGHGKECIHDYWICGWVIDKFTGKVVSTLPRSPEGGDNYAEAVDNGTSTGLKFKFVSKEDSTVLTIQGRAVNTPLRDDQGNMIIPKCRSIKYNFNGNGFDKINEEGNGCNLSKSNEIYGY